MGSPARREEVKDGCEAALGELARGHHAPMAAWIREHLFGHVLPFWERHAFDEQGGLCTCIADDGTVQNTDKWIWSQWRAVWVFSRLYRTLDPDPRWLRHARRIAAFCRQTAWNAPARHWALLVAQDGSVLRSYESTYVDAFAVYGLTELYRATRDSSYLDLASLTADAALAELAGPYDLIPHFPYPIPPGAKPHGIPMLWSLTLAELGAVAQVERYVRAAARLSDEIFREFIRADRNLCLEFLCQDGSELPAPEGTAVVPGHAIEDMWFQIHVERIMGRTTHRRPIALRQIARHLDLGWDQANGGLLLAIDANGREPVGWRFAESKLWWPHTEALYATLLAWKLGGGDGYLEWYSRLWRFCLKHYADWEHGEWRQKLNRDLTPFSGTIALPVKDPYHLPRSLILQIELLGNPP